MKNEIFLLRNFIPLVKVTIQIKLILITIIEIFSLVFFGFGNKA